MKYPILLAIVVLAGLAQSAYAIDPAFVILEYKTMNFENCIATTDKMIVRAEARARRVVRSKTKYSKCGGLRNGHWFFDGLF